MYERGGGEGGGDVRGVSTGMRGRFRSDVGLRGVLEAAAVWIDSGYGQCAEQDTGRGEQLIAYLCDAIKLLNKQVLVFIVVDHHAKDFITLLHFC